MAAISICCNSRVLPHASLFLRISFPAGGDSSPFAGAGSCCRKRLLRFSRICVVSSHTNQKILKPNRKNRYGQPLSPYDSDSDADHSEDEEDDEEDEDEDWNSDDESLQMRASEQDQKSATHVRRDSQSERGRNAKLGYRREIHEVNGGKSSDTNDGNTQDKILGYRNSSSKLTSKNYLHVDRRSKEAALSLAKDRFGHLAAELDLDERWFPLLDYLSTFGFKGCHFVQMYERHMPSLQINKSSAEERLDFLLSVGVKHKDIRKIILRQPQILEYTVENNLKSHVNFLTGLGIPDSRIGQIITATPSLFSYSVENSLKPTVTYLLEEVGIDKNDLCKVVQLSPQILVQRIDTTWTARCNFLTRELGAPRDSIVKMVKKHPQLLHYSIEDGLLPRINFLRSIGMNNPEIVKVLTSITQVFSLSLEGNLKPKYMYLVNELGNEVHSLTKYPMYLSLSLDQRIRPRHKFLVSLKRAPKGPFPLSSLVPTDERFCQHWAGTSLEKYLDFRQTLLLKKLVKKYGRR